MDFPKFSQWKQIFKTIKGSERIIFLSLIFLASFSGFFLSAKLYFSITKEVPTYGGSYTEGIVGQPRFINPIYGETNDTDRTLIGLIYSGLMNYDKDGKLINDLAKNYIVEDDGKVYSFELKDNLYWQDGVKLTTDDIAYTIGIIQNSDYKSPLRANWLDVQFQKISDTKFAFILDSPYNSFLENCTVKIIPQHIWKDILPENFALSSYNLQPLGSGPYMITKLNQEKNGFITNIFLKANTKYHNKKPYISNLAFKFFENKTDLAKAAAKKNIDGFALSSLDDDQFFAEKNIKQGFFTSEKFNINSFTLPRYFAAFFNVSDGKLFSDNNITQALNYSINKQEIADEIAEDSKTKIAIVNSPILPEYFGYEQPTVLYNYDIEAAKQLLDKSNYKDDGSGQRVKYSNKTSSFQFKNYLSSKSGGTEVIELQRCLSKLDSELKNILDGETSGKYGIKTDAAVTAFQEKYIPEYPSTGEVGTATRKKLNEMCFGSQDNSENLAFIITTINQPQLIKIAELLKNAWKNIGAEAQIKAVGISEIKDLIKNRDYDILLYGESLGSEPDLYPFWHSSQIKDPGLNLSTYQNKDVDRLLKEARETLDLELKKIKYEQIQNKILTQCPALFLYNPDYLYWTSQKIKGINTSKIIDPAKRFSNIENWYIKTKRIWK